MGLIMFTSYFQAYIKCLAPNCKQTVPLRKCDMLKISYLLMLN